MMEIEIVSKVNITVTQEDLEEMVLTAIAAENPNVVVDKFKFIAGRNDSGVRVEIDAHLSSDVLYPATSETTPEVSPQMDLPFIADVTPDEPEEVEANTDAPISTLADIFGAPSAS